MGNGMKIIIKYLSPSLAILIFSLLSFTVRALTFHIPKNSDIVGHVYTVMVHDGEDITDIAQRYDVGYFDFLEANPGLDLDNLFIGEKLIVPSRFILPPGPHRGIVINLAELRLYYYPNPQTVMTFPVGIGKVDEPTPLMKTKIIGKRKNPTWTPTKATRKRAEEMGITLPAIIQAGPDNPLGNYAMRLGRPKFLIHGTNDPTGVGLRSSGGCIRMFPKNVKLLFSYVKIGTPVSIVNDPFKVGYIGNKIYLESHVPLNHKRGYLPKTLKPMADAIIPYIKHWHVEINWEQAMHAAQRQLGIPEPIGWRSS